MNELKRRRITKTEAMEGMKEEAEEVKRELKKINEELKKNGMFLKISQRWEDNHIEVRRKDDGKQVFYGEINWALENSTKLYDIIQEDVDRQNTEIKKNVIISELVKEFSSEKTSITPAKQLEREIKEAKEGMEISGDMELEFQKKSYMEILELLEREKAVIQKFPIVEWSDILRVRKVPEYQQRIIPLPALKEYREVREGNLFDSFEIWDDGDDAILVGIICSGDYTRCFEVASWQTL